jgi:hypothetical protein
MGANRKTRLTTHIAVPPDAVLALDTGVQHNNIYKPPRPASRRHHKCRSPAGAPARPAIPLLPRARHTLHTGLPPAHPRALRFRRGAPAHADTTSLLADVHSALRRADAAVHGAVGE